MKQTNYYDEHHNEYLQETLSQDLNILYDRFLTLIPPHSRIVDAGCGGGRDLLYFKNRGYQVEGFDVSAQMASSAHEYSGVPVRTLDFANIDYVDEIDGFWACASLLHIPKGELPQVFSRIDTALRAQGILYCSFKNRDGDFSDGDRTFTCFTPTQLEVFIRQFTPFSIIEIFTTHDTHRKDELWTNALLRATMK
jgi:SAM-dependent methyltransferase